MAINLNQRYSSDNAPTSPDYPFGRGINAVNDQDETSLPFDMDWFNDWSGFFQAVLMAANITPSGTSDTARTSQYLAALRVLFPDQTEADLRYARRSQNLSDLASVTTARTNLGLGGAALFNVGTAGGELPTTNQADQRYTRRSENLSDLANAATARTNLGVSSTVEADARYLNESSNLSDLPSTATARTNLQLGTAAVVDTGTGADNVPTIIQADARYLVEANNLSDLDDPAAARTNLAVLSTTEADARYLVEANNLSDLTNDETARTNLDVYSRSESDARYLNESSNLSDLPSVSTARTNLGVSSTVEADARYLLESNNLSDLTNAATARTNLQLGTAAQAQVNQFIYPNSGLVGSIEKSDLFTTPATVANQFTIRARTYNINGQFVPIAQTTITLAAAESTAARAVAFDDLFVESDGTYRHVRSINARRTPTSFNADQIATDAGYTRVSQGLYSRGGNHALLLGRITRRNQGAYEPQLNPEGSAEVENISLPSTDNVWYVSDRDLTSTQDAFTFQGTGNRGNLNSTGGRPDDLLYDGITANDITPLYFSARAVTDRKALLFDNFNRAVAGETFMGAEGTPLTGNTVTGDQAGSGIFCGIGSSIAPIGLFLGGTCEIIITSSGTATLATGVALNTRYACVSVANSSSTISQQFRLQRTSDSLDSWISAGNIRELTIRVFHTRPAGFTLPSASPQFLSVDVVGALTAMPQEWLDNGIPGNWLAVDEDGGSLIPDGTSKNLKASRKVLELYLAIASTDNGVTWEDRTSGFRAGFEGASNSIQANPQSDFVMMVFYRTTANPFELSINEEYLDYGDGVISNHNSFVDQLGVMLGSNTINKVPVSTDSRAVSSILNYRRQGNTNAFRPDIGITHSPITLGSTTNPAFKSLPYLARNYLHVIYKEIKHNGTSFGDDNQFDIVNNQSTVTDTNGETVIVGQKRVALPHHFDGDLY